MQQKPQKKVPVRRCVGCNTQKPKKELVRIVRSPEGEVSVDLTGKRSGRGAYPVSYTHLTLPTIA